MTHMEATGGYVKDMPMKTEQSVPKRRHIKFRRQGITQQEAYNIQYTAKVWNEKYYYLNPLAPEFPFKF